MPVGRSLGEVSETTDQEEAVFTNPKDPDVGRDGTRT